MFKKLASAGLTALLLGSALVAVPFTATAANADPGAVSQIISDTNEARWASDLPELEENSSLNAVAQAWAEQMAANGAMTHNPNVGSQIPAGWTVWRENVSRGSGPDTVVGAWLASEGHRMNMLATDITDIGVGYFDDNGQAWAVQVFAGYPPREPSEPSAPSLNLADASSITVSWDAPFDGKSPITAYDAHLVNVNTGANVMQTVDGGTLAATFSGLEPGASYYGVVVARNIVGNSGQSAQSDSTRVPPVVPTAASTPTIAIAGYDFNVSWGAPSYNGGAAISSYDVTVTPANPAFPPISVNVSGDTLSANIGGLEPSIAYTATVIANNEAGSAPVSGVSVSVNAPLQPPSQPAAPSLTLVDGRSIILNWAAPERLGGTPVTAYTVSLQNVADGTYITREVVDATTTTFVGLTPGANYVGYVLATNIIGNSPLSVSSATTQVPPVVPGAPEAPSVILSDENQITVNWAAPSYDGGAAISGYEVTLSKVNGASTTVVVDGVTVENVFNDLDPSGRYTATVVAVNVAGKSNASVKSEQIRVPAAPTVPDAPDVATVTNVSSQTATVSWVAPFNGGAAINGYRVVITDSENNVLVDETVNEDTLSYDVTKLNRYSSYKVVVYASNKLGESVASDAANFVTLAETPSAPVNVTVVGNSGSSVKVSWKAPTDDGGSPLKTYTVNVFNSVNALVKTVNVDAGSLSTTVTGLISGETYTAEVIAVNVNKSSAPSVRSTGGKTFTVPVAPKNVTASLEGEDNVKVVWETPVNDGGAAINGYRVTFVPSTGSTIVFSAAAGTNEALFEGLTPGVSYTASVVAVNNVGSSVASTVSNSVKVPAVKATAPRSPKVTLNAPNTVVVSWVAPVNNGGAVISGYTVNLVNDADETIETKTVAGNALTASFTGLVPGSTVKAVVVAVNEAGNSPASVVSNSVKVPAVVPSAPGTPVVVLNNNNTVLDVTWKAPTSNGGAVINGYRVTLTGSDKSNVVVNAETNSVSFTTLTPGVSYVVKVAAKNEVGYSVDSTVSNSVKVPAVAPTAPRNVTVRADSGTTVSVLWNTPVSNGGAVIDSYTVVLTPDNDGEVITKTVAGNVLNVTFDGLEGLTGYSAVVTAVNEAGNSPVSATSPVVITPPATVPVAVDSTELTEDNSNGITAELNGDVLTVHTNGLFVENDWVYGYAYSTPVALGWTQVDANGNVSWNISAANLPVGQHQIALYNVDGDLSGWAAFEVKAPVVVVPPVDNATPTVVVPSTNNETTKTAVEDEIATTGFENGNMLSLGLSALALGFVFATISIVRRRKLAPVRVK